MEIYYKQFSQGIASKGIEVQTLMIVALKIHHL